MFVRFVRPFSYISTLRSDPLSVEINCQDDKKHSGIEADWVLSSFYTWEIKWLKNKNTEKTCDGRTTGWQLSWTARRTESVGGLFGTSLCSCVCSLACWVSLVSGSREYREFTSSFFPASLYLLWGQKTAALDQEKKSPAQHAMKERATQQVSLVSWCLSRFSKI